MRGEGNKPLGFLTLGQGSWRKKIEEEEVYFVFSGFFTSCFDFIF